MIFNGSKLQACLQVFDKPLLICCLIENIIKRDLVLFWLKQKQNSNCPLILFYCRHQRNQNSCTTFSEVSKCFFRQETRLRLFQPIDPPRLHREKAVFGHFSLDCWSPIVINRNYYIDSFWSWSENYFWSIINVFSREKTWRVEAKKVFCGPHFLGVWQKNCSANKPAY